MADAGPARQAADAEAVAHARALAGFRGVAPAFAVIARNGRAFGTRMYERRALASVTKTMLVLAYVSHRKRRDRELTDGERALLAPMILSSSNPEAETIYRAVGDRGLLEVARRAGMKRFHSSHAQFGWTWGWGAASASALDLARLFLRIDRLAPPRHRTYVRGLLRRVDADQAWGIPAIAANAGWKAYFKGGWGAEGIGGIPVNQAGLVSRGGRRAAIAIMTTGATSYDAAADAVAEIAAVLLARA